ncbi:hypothetical protein RND81_13G147000 [Saponaria officinalis]|uniref:Retrotransposon gag domain-containing protein n=1 Tax=Saponaria officinalis TaxID=3572 RepID=A0AAW1H0R2_SAPOF
MLIALSAKNKLCFVDGSSAKPNSTSTNAKNWQRCNDMVFSWILNALSSEIADSVLYSDTAKSAWDELIKRYDQSNGAQLYGVHKKLSEFCQGNDSVTTYFTKLKSIWDEIDAMGMNPKCSCTCTCGATEKQTQFHDNQRVIQFMTGLNEDYSVMRGAILMQSPLPKLSIVYSNLIQEEREREIRHIVQFQVDSASLYAKNGRIGSFSGHNQGFNGKSSGHGGSGHNQGGFNGQQFKSRNQSNATQDVRPPLTCSYCKKPGHTIDRCYRLHNKNRRFVSNVCTGDQGGILGAFDAAQTNVSSAGSGIASPSADNLNDLQKFSPNVYDQLMGLLKQSQMHDHSSSGDANFAGNSFASLRTIACSSSWILDSGTSDHMCSNKFLFSEMHHIPKPYSISLQLVRLLLILSCVIILFSYGIIDWAIYHCISFNK